MAKLPFLDVMLLSLIRLSRIILFFVKLSISFSSLQLEARVDERASASILEDLLLALLFEELAVFLLCISVLG